MTTLVGFNRLKGISKKTGNPYDFFTLYVVDDNPRNDRIFGSECYEQGWTTDTDNKIDYITALVGCPVVINCDRLGKVISIEEVKL